MSDTSNSVVRGEIQFACIRCPGMIFTKDEVAGHRQFHRDIRDKVGQHKNIGMQTAKRTTDWNNGTEAAAEPFKNTSLATKVNEMESSIRNLTRENVEQKEQISALVTDQKRQQAEINAIQQSERDSVKMIEKLNAEIARLKAQQSEPITNPGGNGRENQHRVSRQPVKTRGKAAAPKSAPAPTTRPRTRASGKTGYATVTK